MLPHEVHHASESDRVPWDEYVRTHPEASHYHLYGWRDVIHRTYGHDTHYLMLAAPGGSRGPAPRSESGWRLPAGRVLGVLPLVHLKHLVFGSELVSLPYLDGGGILASDGETQNILLSEAIELARKVGAERIELRHERPLEPCSAIRDLGGDGLRGPLMLSTRTDKVRMLLTLPGSSEALMRSFKSKLRSQIAKPLKEGLFSACGGPELLADFYKVFLVNMRDLGSPVHSIALMRNVLDVFAERARIFVVYKSKVPVASSLVVGTDKVLRNPWASSLRKFASLSPNMLLYLRMLEFACDNGYRVFDFGRSTRGEGTYRFKEQWGAAPAPLFWNRIYLDGKPRRAEASGAEGFETARHYWKKLPLIVTRIIGPSIRKRISL